MTALQKWTTFQVPETGDPVLKWRYAVLYSYTRGGLGTVVIPRPDMVCDQLDLAEVWLWLEDAADLADVHVVSWRLLAGPAARTPIVPVPVSNHPIYPYRYLIPFYGGPGIFDLFAHDSGVPICTAEDFDAVGKLICQDRGLTAVAITDLNLVAAPQVSRGNA